MKKGNLALLASVLVMGIGNVFADEPLVYKTTDYRVWTYNPNYPTSRCFVPSFKVPNCYFESVGKTGNDGCDYKPGSQLLRYAEDHCFKDKPEAVIMYYFSNHKLVRIGGDFGEFDISTDANGYATGMIHGAPPLSGRAYSLELGSQNINESKIRAHKKLDFRVLELSTNCDIPHYKDDKELCQRAAIAEYQIQ